MSTGRKPYESAARFRAFTAKMQAPWLVYQTISYDDYSDKPFDTFISDDDFSDALYQDAEKWFSKKANQHTGFDIRPVLIERLTYWMIDEETVYLLTGRFLDTNTTLTTINAARALCDLPPLDKVTRAQARQNRLLVPPAQLPYWVYNISFVMRLAPYKHLREADIDNLLTRSKIAADDTIRHKKLIKKPTRVARTLGL